MRLGVIFGGVGPEHEASLSSAKAVLDHLDPGCYSFEQFGIGKDGTWLVGKGAWRQLYSMADTALLPAAIRGFSSDEAGAPARRFAGYPDRSTFDGLDCLVPIVDGLGGEDGTLQGFLSFTGKPFTGCGLLAAAQAYDKWTAKRLALAAGLPVARGICVSRWECAALAAQRVESAIGGFDLLVKPVACGSSFGVSRVQRADEFARALAVARRYSASVLVEEYIPHVELFVSVLGNSPDLTIAAPTVEPVPRRRPSTYHDKYIAQAQPLRCPAGLDEAVEAQARALARQAYEALGCRGFARVDLFLRPQTGELLLNEVNTMPGLARNCAFFTGMAALGYDYPALLDTIVALAFDRAGGEWTPRREAVTPPGSIEILSYRDVDLRLADVQPVRIKLEGKAVELDPMLRQADVI